jgi:hypothetical protein
VTERLDGRGMTIGGVLAEGLAIYRRLAGRSILVAGVIFLVVSLADAFAVSSGTASARLVSLALGLIGGLLVQGALVEIVRDLHESRPVARVPEYYARTRGRLGTLVGASIMYGLGVLLGFLAFIVPGLIAIARWSLVVPLVMIERLGWREAFRRSSELVRGQTGRVLALIVIANVLTSVATLAVRALFGATSTFWSVWIGGTVAGALVVPFEAHVLTALYYRLTEPERPVLPDPGTPARTWESIWDEERE